MRTLSFRLKIALLRSHLGAGAGRLWWDGVVAGPPTKAGEPGHGNPRARGATSGLDWFARQLPAARRRAQIHLRRTPREPDHLARQGHGRHDQHTSSGWPADLDPAQLDCVLADDASAITLGGGARRGPGSMGRGFGPRGGMGQVTFTKIPRFQTVRTAQAEWRLGFLGTADTTLVIGLNLAGPQAELNRLRNAFLLVLPMALLLVGLGGWLVAGRALSAARHRGYRRPRHRQRLGSTHSHPQRQPRDGRGDPGFEPHDGSLGSQLSPGHPVQR